VRGKGVYGWFTLFGFRAKDGLRVRLGRATSQHVAEGIALSILRGTSMWSRIDVLAKGGKVVKRIEKPQEVTEQ